jgi:hypothetical protein
LDLKLLVTIPTLGKRLSSLKFTLASIQEFIPFADIEIRTPNVDLESQIMHFVNKNTRVVIDQAGQALAIINSWNENQNIWCTWINDDDFALDGFSATTSLMSQYEIEKKPIVIYGDLIVMSAKETLRVKTPKRISKWLLSGGSDYIPGVLTVINREAVKIVTQSSLRDGLLRNSFDYQWWLQLADAAAFFKHSGACHAAWRDHPDARTKMEFTFSKLESDKLKTQYIRPILGVRYIKNINSIVAKIFAKISSLRD